ncbi:MAG TPA: metallophosphoesterase [Novosphingobium sp.]|nr:metallophosphoesterase [Novosphingobium sp.]
MTFARTLLAASMLVMPALAGAQAPADKSFTIAVIPDTQNYVDYTHQKEEGFAFDAAPMLMEQMKFVADHTRGQGGDIDFVITLGDAWQHQTLPIDPGFAARGFRRGDNPFINKLLPPTPKVMTVEAPKVREAYAQLDGKVAWSAVPGNHDYDAQWPDANHPQKAEIKTESDLGLLHSAGLNNWRWVFSDQSDFFRNKPWYVASHDGGADNAQIFTAGGYKFLHIGLQFDAPNASLEWAAEIVKRYPGLPTIISMHDFLQTGGAREPNPVIDNHALDPDANTPQMMWDKFLSQHDQIFMVLCGHEHAQAFRTDANRFGHPVYQILSDYQGRQQTVLDAGAKPTLEGIGDGWMRLMTFDFSGQTPKVKVHTYSTHYKKMSTEMPEYAKWYKGQEHPGMTDAGFEAMDDYAFDLTGFTQRFGAAKMAR